MRLIIFAYQMEIDGIRILWRIRMRTHDLIFYSMRIFLFHADADPDADGSGSTALALMLSLV